MMCYLLHLISPFRHCAYELIFPEGQLPYTSYLFAVHTIRVLPWMILLDGEWMILMSADCTRHANTDDRSPLPCISCWNLHNHTVIMGIWHCALDGAHKNTPWSFLSIIQLLHLLDQKNQQIAGLHMRGLNAGQSLAFCDQCLDRWKQFAVAIGSSNLAHIQVLIKVELWNGAGIFGLLNKIDHATAMNYWPCSYEEANFQCSFLLWKLGSRSAANFAHCTLGCPSINSVHRHIGTKPLATSPGMPTLADITTNLAIGFENQPHDRTHIIGICLWTKLKSKSTCIGIHEPTWF